MDKLTLWMISISPPLVGMVDVKCQAKLNNVIDLKINVHDINKNIRPDCVDVPADPYLVYGRSLIHVHVSGAHLYIMLKYLLLSINLFYPYL